MSPRKKHLNQALLNAVLRNDLTAIQAALADGADVNARDPEHQETPLMLTRSEAAARLPLDHGADINAQEDEGRTALMRAVAAVSVDEVRRVLALGADPNLRDSNRRTALSLAEDYGLLAIAECPREAKGDNL